MATIVGCVRCMGDGWTWVLADRPRFTRTIDGMLLMLFLATRVLARSWCRLVAAVCRAVVGQGCL